MSVGHFGPAECILKLLPLMQRNQLTALVQRVDFEIGPSGIKKSNGHLDPT